MRIVHKVRYTGKRMDDAYFKDLLEKERHRVAELTVLLTAHDTSVAGKKEQIIRDIGNKTLHSCGGPTGVTGIPLILDACYPIYALEAVDTSRKFVHHKPAALGTTDAEFFSMGKILVKAYLSMTERIYVAYQIDLAAKGYTGTEADDLAFYLSRKETYFPWYKTPGTGFRKFATVFDIFDVSAEDVGLHSEVIHDDIVRFYQIWIKYLPRRDWDSLVKHIISDRWGDHGQIGILINRLYPVELDPSIVTLLFPDGTPINKDVEESITKRFGLIFRGNTMKRLENESDSNDDQIRARQLRYVRHAGRLNPAPHHLYHSLVWGAGEPTKS